MSLTPESSPAPISVGSKCAYGAGQLAEGIKNGALGAFLIFYYSQVLGLSAYLAGLAVGTALFIDALTDPLAGSLSDHLRSRYGRRHPYMLASALPLAASFYLLFAPPALGEWALFCWLVLFVNLSRTAITFFQVPHLALGAELANDHGTRASLVAYRMFFNLLGAYGASMIGFHFFFAPTPDFPVGQLNGSAYAPFAATLSALMVAAIILTTWGTRKFIPYLPRAMPGGAVGLWGILKQTNREMMGALRQRTFAWLFSGVLLVFLMIGTNAALDMHMVTYFWELSSKEVVSLTPAYPIGVVLGIVFAAAFQRRYSTRTALLFGTAWWAAFQVVPILLRLVGWFPDNHDETLVPLLAVIRVLQGAGAVQANIAFGIAIAETADENELQNGLRQEGIFFSASSFSGKFASGVGSLIAGVALSLISWPRGAHVQFAVDVGPELVMQLGLIYGPLVVGFSLVTMWCYSHYHITRAGHAETVFELNRRRERALRGQLLPPTTGSSTQNCN